MAAACYCETSSMTRWERCQPQRTNASGFFGHDDVGLADDRVAERNFDAEGLSVDLAGELCDGGCNTSSIAPFRTTWSLLR